MKKIAIILTLALLATASFYSCQEEELLQEDPITNVEFEQEGDGVSFRGHKDNHGNGNNNNNGTGGGGNEVTYSVDLAKDDDSDPPNTITSLNPGTAGISLFVTFDDGDIIVTSSDGDLTVNPSFSVDVNNQGAANIFQFWIKAEDGKSNPLYGTDAHVIPPAEGDGDVFKVPLGGPYELWRLKKWNGGPKQELVGHVTFGYLLFTKN